MKLLLTIAFSVAAFAAAEAQSFLLPPRLDAMPRTIPWTDTSRAVTNGTATFSGNRIYLRNDKGEHVATLVVGPGGTRTMYDPNGKIIKERDQ